MEDGILGSLELMIWRMLDDLLLYMSRCSFYYMLLGVSVRMPIYICGLVYGRVVSIGLGGIALLFEESWGHSIFVLFS